MAALMALRDAQLEIAELRRKLELARKQTPPPVEYEARWHARPPDARARLTQRGWLQRLREELKDAERQLAEARKEEAALVAQIEQPTPE
jgi:hypothetical protein